MADNAVFKFNDADEGDDRGDKSSSSNSGKIQVDH